MLFDSILYRYIFHGTQLSVDPAYQSYLSNLALDDLSTWESFEQGMALSVGKTVCLKVSPYEHETVYFKRYLYKKNLWDFSYAEAKPPTNSLITNG